MCSGEKKIIEEDPQLTHIFKVTQDFYYFFFFENNTLYSTLVKQYIQHWGSPDSLHHWSTPMNPPRDGAVWTLVHSSYMLPPLCLCPSLCTPWLALDPFIPVTRYHLPPDFTHRLLCYQISGKVFIHFFLTTYKRKLPMIIKLSRVRDLLTS